MSKLLSIGIPTFNRAEQLDNQLAWLQRAINGFEDECEIIVSDNCSTDDTQKVIEKWQKVFNKTEFRANRNMENIGWMRNFSYIINAATGKYVWTVGDDDPIRDTALAYVITCLRNNSDLSLLYLNFSDKYKPSGKVSRKHWFATNLEDSDLDGEVVFQKCIEKSFGSVIFITSTIYRTDLVQAALKKWPDSVKNWGGQAYWTGLCATFGKVIVSKENYVECIINDSHWQKDPRSSFNIRYRDIPEVYIKLRELGYSQTFLDQLMIKHFRARRLRDSALDCLKALRSYPFQALPTLISFFTLVLSSYFRLLFSTHVQKELQALEPILEKPDLQETEEVKVHS
jgi:glycosyltransferase involved in cell wall biosynthesis